MAGNVFQFNPRQPAHSSLGQVPEKPLAKGAVPRPSVGYTTLDDLAAAQEQASTQSGYAGPSGFGRGAPGAVGGGGLGVGAFSSQGQSAGPGQVFDASIAQEEPAPQVPATTQQGWLGWAASGLHRTAKATPWWVWLGLVGLGTWSAYRYGTGRSVIPFRGRKRNGRPAKVVIDAMTSDDDDGED